MAEAKKPEGLSILLRVAFGMGNMLNVLGVVGMWFPYASAFFTKVLGLSGSQAGTIVLVAQVAGGIFAPMVVFKPHITSQTLPTSHLFTTFPCSHHTC